MPWSIVGPNGNPRPIKQSTLSYQPLQPWLWFNLSQWIGLCIYLFIYFRFYLFLERGKGRKKERKRNIDVWKITLAASHSPPNWGPGPQPRHVPWLGIEPVTFWFAGQHSIHWATLAKADSLILIHSSQRWKQHKYPSMDEYKNKMCSIHTKVYYSRHRKEKP